MDFDLAVCYTLVRLGIPFLLLFVVSIRQNLFSFLYLIHILVAPFLSYSSARSLTQGCLASYQKFLILTSTLICVTQIVFQVVLLILPEYENTWTSCSLEGLILNSIGLHFYSKVDILSFFRLILVDFVVFFSVSILFIINGKVYASWLERQNKRRSNQTGASFSASHEKKPESTAMVVSDLGGDVISQDQSEQDIIETSVDPSTSHARASLPSDNFLRDVNNQHQHAIHHQKLLLRHQRKIKALETMRIFIEIFFAFLLLTCGILNPSLSSAFYFVSFLLVVTLVSCNISMGLFYDHLKLVLCFLSSIQAIALFLYQMYWFRQGVPAQSLTARLSGLTPYVTSNCTEPTDFHFQSFNWNIYAHPFLVLCLYFVTATFLRFRKHNIIEFMHDLADDKSEIVGHSMPLRHFTPPSYESTPLLTGNHPPRYQALQDSRNDPGSFQRGRDIPDARWEFNHKEESPERASFLSSSKKPSSDDFTSPASPNPRDERSKKWAPFLYLTDLVKRGSYSATLIVMMTWSITYHSWLGFILLLWSCVIWMVPNSRQACLKSSFALVLYAIFLLISQYIFSLDLTDQELPLKIGNIELQEIGFKKYHYLSYEPLALKTLFTLMFWITLRQHQEEKALKILAQLRDGNSSFLAASSNGPPETSFRRHMSLASGALPANPALIWISSLIRNLFIKYWIWVVAIMLMVMSLGGNKVVIYRIVYMLLFLSFIFIFQCSFRVWRNLMYPFWLLVIVYSMTVLIAIYTYQFNYFDQYWRDYLFTSQEMQEALGLERYNNDPWILFKQLFTPTFFLIITIIQLRFWHRDFLEFTKYDVSPSTSTTSERGYDNIVQQLSSSESSSGLTTTTSSIIRPDANTKPNQFHVDIEMRDDEDDIESFSSISPRKEPKKVERGSRAASTPSNQSSVLTTTTVRTVQENPRRSILLPDDLEIKPRKRLRFNVSDLSLKLKQFGELLEPISIFTYELIWRLLEIHTNKLVFLIVIIAALKEVSLINSVLMILIAIATPLPGLRGFTCLLIGAYASLIIICKLVYQIRTVNESVHWTSNCTAGETELIYDNNVFIGFKVVGNDAVFNYISLDLLVALFLTLRSVVVVRQKIHYIRAGIKPLPPGIALPNVSRGDAEKGFIGLAKFVLNFGFFRFGLELTCFMIAIAIGYRSDSMSVFLAINLAIFTLCSRETVRKVWPYFLAIMSIMLPLEYLMCVGLPPGLCWTYKWSSLPIDLQRWLFLPTGFPNSLDSSRLFYDFFVIIFSSCQSHVFSIENGSERYTHPAGSNCEQDDTQNSSVMIEDFFTSGKNRYDHLRAAFFTSFCWLTLAVVFWAAMAPNNLFGVGYIIGCFVFLWSGSEFYLRPYKSIIFSWKILIFYNISVIISKIILEIGCVYFVVSSDFCWLISLVCQKKESTESCNFQSKVSTKSNQITWDIICLCFLLIQKRIFGSHYFKFLVKEIWAQTTLASRGAQLIHEVQLKEVREQEAAEKEVMQKIKNKMDRIRANQQASLGNKVDKMKYHYQDNVFDMPAYYINGEVTYAHTPEPGETPLPSTLPTVYSPTPSIPSMMSPSSAASHAEGKGYLEVYRVPYSPRYIDTQSTIQTGPSFSSRSSPFDEISLAHQPYSSSHPHTQPLATGQYAMTSETGHIPPLPPAERIPPETAIMSRPSFRVHRKPSKPLSRFPSIRRRVSIQSSLEASHGSSVKSGDYYMFDDPDSEEIDLCEREVKNHVPDPVGEELDRLAAVHGVTTFCSMYIQGQATQAELESRRRAEESTEMGESSKDSAIISVDREISEPPSTSGPTQMSSLPSTSEHPEMAEDEGSSTISAGTRAAMSEKESERLAELKGETDVGFWTSLVQKLIWWSKMFAVFFTSCVISLTAKLNTISRDYRYVSRRLNIEKIALKKYFQDEVITSWDKDGEKTREALERISKSNLEEFTKSGQMIRPSSSKQLDQSLELKAGERFQRTQSDDKVVTPDAYLDSNFFVRFLWASFYAIVSHSEILCYFLVILNQLLNASLLTLPLSFMVFMWGCLSVPRPTRIFWVSIITYTELVIVTKYILSFQSWPWHNKTDTSPFWLPRLFGADSSGNSNSQFDLLLLLALFFHRFMLKSLGLWDVEPTFDTLNEEKSEQQLTEFGADRDTRVIEESGKVSVVQKEIEVRRRIVPRAQSHSGESIEEALPRERSSQSVEAQADDGEVVHRLIEAGEKIPVKFLALFHPFAIFYRRIMSPPFRITRDYYALMFFCDFINFFTVWFGYSSFGAGPGGDDITTYLQENRVPMPFLAMLLFQFILIIFDRALYLRKDIQKRLIFHISIVFIIHIWLFFALPAITNRSFTSKENLAPKLWYIFKSIYLLLSARQIKSGYPTRILGNCFTKKYGVMNSYLFLMYMGVPFLYDLRLLMDWMWTDTSLGLGEWAIMEDINKQLFIRKCELNFEENFPEPRSAARRRRPKYLRGGVYLLGMIGAIWFPLFIFALGGTIGQSNKPSDFSVELEFSGYQPIFKMSSTSDALEVFDDKTFLALEEESNKNFPAGMNFLTNYGYQDTVKANINGNSTAVWGISPPSENSLINKLESNDSIIIVKVTWAIVRPPSPGKTHSADLAIVNSHTVEITSANGTLRESLKEMLQQSFHEEGESPPATLKQIWPNYIEVPENGAPNVIHSLGGGFRDIQIVLRKGRFDNGSLTQWWEISEPPDCETNSPFTYFNDGGRHCRYITSVLFSHKVFPGPLLQLISGYGIFGLYTTFVFVVSRLIRGFLDDICTKVIYTQMPCVDRVLQLCLNIYLVRESREFGLEEDLYAKLIFLYRSPETLIKWTRPIEPAEMREDNQ
ncbi:piezo type mechanosensitive ion channel component isoform X3 [Brevipalpus obovatus]|uniref:piezo type mechanosensitive ion channel component isoform X3 n=1 Tax=Brevipalpus obovatus TaxID=246614 RepID=UPI003D9FA8F5